MEKFYLRIENDNTFGFVLEGIHEILDTDIPVSIEDYNKFFEIQSSGKQYKLKKTRSKGNSLFDFVEACDPDLIEENSHEINTANVSEYEDNILKRLKVIEEKLGIV